MARLIGQRVRADDRSVSGGRGARARVPPGTPRHRRGVAAVEHRRRADGGVHRRRPVDGRGLVRPVRRDWPATSVAALGARVGAAPRPGRADESHPPPDVLIELHPLGAEALGELAACVTADDPLPPHDVRRARRPVRRKPVVPPRVVERGACRRGRRVLAPIGRGAAHGAHRPTGRGRANAAASPLGPRGGLRRRATSTTSLLGGYERSDEGIGRLGEFLRSDDGGWVWFRHHLVRDVAYEGLPYSVRRELHERVAESIVERVGADDGGDAAALLSLHFSRASRPAGGVAVLRGSPAIERRRSSPTSMPSPSTGGRCRRRSRSTWNRITARRRWPRWVTSRSSPDMFTDARRSYTAARQHPGAATRSPNRRCS